MCFKLQNDSPPEENSVDNPSSNTGQKMKVRPNSRVPVLHGDDGSDRTRTSQSTENNESKTTSSFEETRNDECQLLEVSSPRTHDISDHSMNSDHQTMLQATSPSGSASWHPGQRQGLGSATLMVSQLLGIIFQSI